MCCLSLKAGTVGVAPVCSYPLHPPALGASTQIAGWLPKLLRKPLYYGGIPLTGSVGIKTVKLSHGGHISDWGKLLGPPRPSQLKHWAIFSTSTLACIGTAFPFNLIIWCELSPDAPHVSVWLVNQCLFSLWSKHVSDLYIHNDLNWY